MAASRQVWTRYYYDGLNIVMTRESSAATGGAGSWLTRRAYTLKQASIGQIVAEHTATAWNAATGRPSAWTHRFYHFDLLGNTTAETDANGMVANLIDMEAFGTVLQGGQAGFRLTTKEYDPEAGAYYFNARWYQPGVGRFAQRANISPWLEHPYVFCHSSPSLHSDPSGEFVFSGVGAFVGAVVGTGLGIIKGAFDSAVNCSGDSCCSCKRLVGATLTGTIYGAIGGGIAGGAADGTGWLVAGVVAGTGGLYVPSSSVGSTIGVGLGTAYVGNPISERAANAVCRESCRGKACPEGQ